jgi:hypothetical protein
MVGDMVQPEIVELCADCLVGAATETDRSAELALTAIALARDLADAHPNADAVELLEAATRRAITRLDASDLDTHAFGDALRQLANLRAMVDTQLDRIAVASPRGVDANRAGR